MQPQKEQQTGGNIIFQSSILTSASTKSPLRPKTDMEEFKPGDKTSSPVKPPNTFFEPNHQLRKANPGKPVVSISAYPSPNHRPQPVKLDFLPSSGNKGAQVNGVADGSPTVSLQKELVSTLSRANLRQVHPSQQLPSDAPVSSGINKSNGSSSTEATTAAGSSSFTTTTIQNNVTSPNASLSTKYRGIGQDNQVTIVMKG